MIYLLDTFQGTSGTLLTSHTGDYGYKWPSDVNHMAGGGLYLDGNGGLYNPSTTATSQQIPLAPFPSTPNFEVIFDWIYLSNDGGYGAVILFEQTSPSISYPQLWVQFTTSAFQINVNASGSVVTLATTSTIPTPPATWRIKTDVITTGGTASYKCYYSANGGSTWNSLLSYSESARMYPITIAAQIARTGQSPTTGIHIGHLLVQDLPGYGCECGTSALLGGM